MAFKIGDVVQLKGGSPIMTITALGKDADGNPRATCTWFDSANIEQTGVYVLEALKPYVEERLPDNDGDDFMTR